MDKFPSPGLRLMYHTKQMAGPIRCQDLGFPASSQSFFQQVTLFSTVYKTAPGGLGENNQCILRRSAPKVLNAKNPTPRSRIALRMKSYLNNALEASSELYLA